MGISSNDAEVRVYCMGPLYRGNRSKKGVAAQKLPAIQILTSGRSASHCGRSPHRVPRLFALGSPITGDKKKRSQKGGHIETLFN